MKFLGVLVVIAAVVLALVQMRGSGTPPMFTDLTYEDAIKQQGDPGEVLLVKATATWCGPCKVMDRETFRDTAVEAWFKNGPVAIKLDIDARPDVAQALQITGVPTTILYVGGEEVGRKVGVVGPGELVAWMDERTKK